MSKYCRATRKPSIAEETLEGVEMKGIILRRATRIIAIVALLVAAASAAAELEPPPDGVDGLAIAQRAEGNLRSGRTIMQAEMTIVSPRRTRPRKVVFRSWDDQDAEHSFIRIITPLKDKGTSFLKLQSNLWMYVPRVERSR